MSPAGGPDPRDRVGLRFRVTDLRRSPGSRSSDRRVVSPGTIDDPDDLAGGEVRVVASAPATVDVDMESLADGVRVHTTVRFRWEGACRRCLGTASGTATSEIRELYVDDPASYRPSEGTRAAGQGDAASVDWEARGLIGGWVDLRESVRDAMLLGLPLAPLCSEDCAGPSPEDFPVEVPAEGVSTASVRTGDPRWAALEELHFDPEEA